MTETHKPRMETDPGLAPLVGGLGGGVWAGGMWSGQGDMWEPCGRTTTPGSRPPSEG